MSLVESTDGCGKDLSHDAAKKFFQHQNTKNYATQAVAIDANVMDIQSTGGAICFINGEFILALTGDAAFDISAGLQGTPWITAQSYTAKATAPMLRSVGGRQYFVIADHTSSASNKPVSGADWRTYWKESDSTAINAKGVETSTLNSRYILVCADRIGELSVWLAGPQELDAAAKCIIPQFEEEVFVPVALMLINAGTSGHTFGTDTLSGVTTYYQLTNTPIYPGPKK